MKPKHATKANAPGFRNLPKKRGFVDATPNYPNKKTNLAGIPKASTGSFPFKKVNHEISSEKKAKVDTSSDMNAKINTFSAMKPKMERVTSQTATIKSEEETDGSSEEEIDSSSAEDDSSSDETPIDIVNLFGDDATNRSDDSLSVQSIKSEASTATIQSVHQNSKEGLCKQTLAGGVQSKEEVPVNVNTTNMEIVTKPKALPVIPTWFPPKIRTILKSENCPDGIGYKVHTCILAPGCSMHLLTIIARANRKSQNSPITAHGSKSCASAGGSATPSPVTTAGS